MQQPPVVTDDEYKQVGLNTSVDVSFRPTDSQDDVTPAVSDQLPPFEVEAIEAAGSEKKPHNWTIIGRAVTKPLHSVRHRLLGHKIRGFESLGPDQQEAIAVTAELGDEVLALPGDPEQSQDDDSRDTETTSITEHYRPGEFVREAPRFSEQAEDESRLTRITYANHLQRSMTGAYMEHESQRTVTEHEGLKGLRDFLQEVIAQERNIPRLRANKAGQKARSMLENLSYIGKPEYDEAVVGIANRWRQQLLDDPDLQICVLSTTGPSATKSGAFLLDNILRHFSDDELNTFHGRLVTQPENLTTTPDKTRLVLLDDWVSSGIQMNNLMSRVFRQYPELKQQVSVQLVAATNERIEHGMAYYTVPEKPPEYFPVYAYFKAHDADSGNDVWDSATHITGYYCSVDYGFNDTIAMMAQEMHVDMPPLTNIIRPYRSGSFVPRQYLRLHEPEVVLNG